MSDTPVDDIVDALKAAGLRAESEEFYPGPSDVRIALNGADLVLARHHNIDGWEGAVDVPGRDQYGIEDGPGPDAPPEAVVAWVQTRIAEGLKEF